MKFRHCNQGQQLNQSFLKNQGVTFNSAVQYEYTDHRFKTPEPFRQVEFQRDWNVLNNQIKHDEHLASAVIDYQKNTLGAIHYKVATFLQDSVYKALQQEASCNIRYHAFGSSISGSYLTSNATTKYSSSFFRPKADIYYTTDYVDAELLRQKGLLAPFQSSLTDGVPAEFKAPDGAWTGVIGRSRNIMVNTTLVKPADYPASVFDLADPKWKGRIAITRLTDGTPVWLASLILLKGEEATTAFLTTLFKTNGMKVLNGGSNVADAVAQGEFAAGFVNHYYYVPKKRAGAPVDLVYPDEATGGIGTLVIPLTVAALKSAPHPNVARAFIDFVLSPEGAAPMMTQEGEFPLRPGIPLGDHGADGVRTIDKIRRPAAFDIDKLLAARDRAIELYTPLFT
ncbi:MAG: extracellular solute-binding protein [Proteobacteria bacterium]|nr:extracellular solute-binding protein [Pseudomonadota bacterium]